MRILKVRRNIACPARPNVGNGGINAIDGTVGLGRGRHQNDRLRERNPRLGQSQLERAVHARLDDGGALRVRQTDILTRNDKHTPRRGDHIACLEQPREIMQRRVRVGAAHGLLQCREDVIMAIAVAVVAHIRALRRLLRVRERNAVRPRTGDEQLDRAERLSHVAADRLRDIVRHAVLDRLGSPVHREGERPLNRPAHIRRLDRLELEYRAAA